MSLYYSDHTEGNILGGEVLTTTTAQQERNHQCPTEAKENNED